MKKKLPAMLAAAALALITIGAAACGGKDAPAPSGDLTKVTLNEVAHSIFYAPQYVALEEGYFAEEGIELELVSQLSREYVLKNVLAEIGERYGYILIDNMPSLGMLTINALAAADSVIIPTQAHFLSVMGLDQLLQTIGKIRKQINVKLQIDGILMTMVDNRSNFSKEIIELLQETYGSVLNIYDTRIPFSIRAAEASAEGSSIYVHDPKGKVACAYEELTEEVLRSGSKKEQCIKDKA